ncbi:hypothetical protein Golob_017855 [Gossypium lobatum]|uniref:Uncharacterized protein n=1 Tax=Gossypium lobatum TaxID=34289 RepID=A0A7J8M8M5_9ROSI|nr:hypothetical protein [Gossypium lobatum]
MPNKFQCARIEIKWLEDNFSELDEHATSFEKEQYARTFILRFIRGFPMLDKSRNLIHLRWNFGASYVGLPEQLKDIRLLLDQCLEAVMSYADLAIVKCIPSENLANQSMWDANVPLVVYATVEIHESIQVIPRGTTGLSSARSQQGASIYSPLSSQFLPYFLISFTNHMYFTQAPHYAPLQNLASTPPSSVFFVALPSPAYYTLMMTLISTPMPMYPPTITITRYYPQPAYATLYTYPSIVLQTPPVLLFYQSGSCSQPPSRKMDETRWKARMTPNSTTEEEMKMKMGGQDEDVDEE